MSLSIETYTNPGAKGWRPGNNIGGSTLFKALGHPLIAAKARALRAKLAAAGTIAVYDPLDQAACFDAFYGLTDLDVADVFVQKIEDIGAKKLGRTAKPVTALAQSRARTILIAAFDASKLADQIRELIPAGAMVLTFDELRLPEDMLSNKRNYLDPLNFATNFGFLRDGKGQRTVLSSANYWSGYGAKNPELWLCLFGNDGQVLADPG